VTSLLDPVLGAAVDLARAAVLEVAPADQVGDHLGVVVDETDPALASHRFACTRIAYRGWHWSVTVVAVPGSGAATVSEVVLLPGDDALLAPAWLPWNERVRPGDLGPGDLHPTSPEDPRLEPGFTGSDALEELDDPASPYAVLRPEQWELGLGRERVLSSLGRDLAVERWYEGDRGPSSAMAKAAPASCTSCGFLMPIGGLVGQAFGVCANPFGADGMVVALDYGCGAHSSVREIEGTGIPVTDVVVDEYGFVEVHARDAADGPEELVPSQVVIDDADAVDDLDTAEDDGADTDAEPAAAPDDLDDVADLEPEALDVTHVVPVDDLDEAEPEPADGAAGDPVAETDADEAFADVEQPAAADPVPADEPDES